MDQNSLRKIIENRISTLEGNAFQDFCDRIGLTLYPGDYTPVRAGGRQGDEKNDGYCPKARIFFQAHATRGEEVSYTKNKIKEDLAGCIKKHSDVRQWVYLTNITLIGTIETYIDERRQEFPQITIETWDHKVVANKISSLSIKEIEYILDIILTPLSSLSESNPTVDVIPPIGCSGGSTGHFESFTLKNIGKAAAIDCVWGITGDNYEWHPPSNYLGKTLLPAEEIKEVPYQISSEATYKTVVDNLKVFIKYCDENGREFITFRDLKQVRVPSGDFFNFELGKFHPANTYAESKKGSQASGVPQPVSSNSLNNIKKFEQLLEEASWVKESIDNKDFWICDSDTMFQVEICDDYRDFTEKWTQVYPDKFGSGRHSVNLKIYGVTIKQLSFIFCDGGRISVPMPDFKIINEEIQYFWKKNSLEYKLAKIIGTFYIYDNLEGIADMSKIELTES